MTETLRCPTCGLTYEELAKHGHMGCPACYRVFARLVAQAVEVLHGVAAPVEPSPWPTRRALSPPRPKTRA
jgi:protein arginine kinase activator